MEAAAYAPAVSQPPAGLGPASPTTASTGEGAGARAGAGTGVARGAAAEAPTPAATEAARSTVADAPSPDAFALSPLGLASTVASGAALPPGQAVSALGHATTVLGQAIAATVPGDSTPAADTWAPTTTLLSGPTHYDCTNPTIPMTMTNNAPTAATINAMIITPTTTSENTEQQRRAARPSAPPPAGGSCGPALEVGRCC
ncbi:hypothetical protein EJB05_28743, partial [Eragrostis curvula]